MAGYGNSPFGLRQIALYNADGTGKLLLPAALMMHVTPLVETARFTADGHLVGAAALVSGAEWELEAGGISLEAIKVMTGRTIALTGTTPNQVNTVLARAGDTYPWFKIYGKSVGDGADDIHVLIYKAKLTDGLEGEFADGEFYVQSCSGIAVDNGSKLYEIVQNETATTVPAS